jgi:hypothetical protein
MHNPYAPPATAFNGFAYVQVVGRSCDRCGKTVAREREGVACRECDLAYHRRCLLDQDVCPKCSQSMSALERAAADAEAIAMGETLYRGRILVWAAILPYALVEVVLIGLAVSRGLTASSLMIPVRVAIDGTLVWMTVNGSSGARRWIAFFCGVGVLVLLAMVVSRPNPLAGLSLVECAFALWVFTVSADARAYLESKARMPET